MLKPLSFLDLLILKVKLKIRNYLTKKLPYFAYSNITNEGHSEVQISHSSNSYSCKLYKGDELDSIRTGRYDFTEIYNVYFKDGTRYLSLFSKDNTLIFNHKNVLIHISFNEEEVNLTVKQKGNSYV